MQMFRFVRLFYEVWAKLSTSTKKRRQSTLSKSSFVHPSTIQQAGITILGNIVRVRFNLKSCGFVVVQETENRFKANTSTACDLLLGLQSLSRATNFSIYMRQSDYAIESLRKLNSCLRSSFAGPLTIDLKHFYNGRPAMILDWSRIEYSDQQQQLQEKTSLSEVGVPESLQILQKEQPPSYSEGPSIALANVLVPESPPTIVGGAVVPRTEDASVRETPPCASAVPPTPRPTSPGDILDFGQQLDNIREEADTELDSDKVRRRAESETIEGPLNEIDSDEEWYSMFDAQYCSPAIPPTSEILESQFTSWLSWAVSVNKNVFKHQRLTSKLPFLGYCASTSNPTAFTKTRIWCSAMLFYDPTDMPELRSPASRWLILEIAELLSLSNSLCFASELCSSRIREEFEKMGTTARAIVLKPGCAEDAMTYHHQKAKCLSSIYCEFGRPVKKDMENFGLQ